jgi:cell division septum initiation protein DivIVA
MTAPMIPTSTKMTESDILRMLDQLEALVDGSRHLFGQALWVNLDQFFSLTQNIRQHLPEDIRRANKVARDCEKIVEQARGEAERIRAEAAGDAERIVQDSRRGSERLLRDAQEQAARLISEHELLRQAQQESRGIIQTAQDEARQTRRGADEYASQVLGQLEDVLSKASTNVRRGLERLERETVSE